jgi:hypothetical protein
MKSDLSDRYLSRTRLGISKRWTVLAFLFLLSALVLPHSLHAQAGRTFSWKYRFDPPGQQGREWKQIGSSKWLERLESGRQNNFTVTKRPAMVEGNRGQIVEREDHALSVFIPDTNAQGNNPDWLRVWRKGDTHWLPLGRIVAPPVYTY